jgi:RNA polymerase sigma-70 factor (ECF subfamily)
MESLPSELLIQFRQGNPETLEAAFETLFRQHQRAVYGWILRIVRNPSAAEELTVETFWRIHQARARFEAARGFEGWARRIGTRVALDWLRSQHRLAEVPVDCVAELAAPSVGDPAIAAEIRRKTRAALERLPPALRIAAVLAVVEEQPYKVVAEALGISVAAVKLRVFRALRLLRKDLKKQGITP